MANLEAIVDPYAFDSSLLFGIIGERHRLKILRVLMSGKCTVQEIGRKVKIEKTLLSKHLKALREVGLVFALREGRQLIYQINPRVRGSRTKYSLKLHCCEIRLKDVKA